MKSERRHELQTNALADWIGEAIERIRPYQTTLLGVALLVMLLIGGPLVVPTFGQPSRRGLGKAQYGLGLGQSGHAGRPSRA